MDEIQKKISNAEKKITRFEKLLHQLILDAKADGIIESDEKQQIAYVVKQIKEVKDRIQTLKSSPEALQKLAGKSDRAAPAKSDNVGNPPVETESQMSVYDESPMGSWENPGSAKWQEEQDAAKKKYEPLAKRFRSVIENARTSPGHSDEIARALAEVKQVFASAESSAKRGRDVLAQDRLRIELPRVDALQQLLSAPGRQEYLTSSSTQYLAILGRYPACLGDFDNEHADLLKRFATMEQLAAGNDYERARDLSHALGAEISALDVQISDLRNYRRAMAKISTLEPGLTAAKTIDPGEEEYESLSLLRKKIHILESKAHDLATRTEFDEAFDVIDVLAQEIEMLDREIALKESAPPTEITVAPGPLTDSFVELAETYGVSPAALWAMNPELSELRGSPADIQPGDKVIVPDAELQVELYDNQGTLIIVTKKQRLEIQRLLSIKIGKKIEAKVTSDFDTYRRIERTLIKLNTSFIGSLVCIFARTDNDALWDQYSDAYRAQGQFRDAVKAEDLGRVESRAEYYTDMVRVYGRALYDWREKLIGGAKLAIKTTRFVRDASFTIAGTIAAGPIIEVVGVARGAELAWKGRAVVNGLTNTAAGILGRVDDTVIDARSGEDVGWSEVADIFNIKKAAFEFATGSAADALLSGTKSIIANWLKDMKPCTCIQVLQREDGVFTEFYRHFATKIRDARLAVGVKEIPLDKGELLNIFGSYAYGEGMNALDGLIPSHWKDIVTHALDSDLEGEATMERFHQALADSLPIVAPGVLDDLVAEFAKSSTLATYEKKLVER